MNRLPLGRLAVALSAIALMLGCGSPPVGHATAPAASASQRVAGPLAEARTVSDVYFGTRVDDPYRHLEDTKAPATEAWMKSQAAHAAGVLRRIQGRETIRARLDEIEEAATARIGEVVRLANGRLFYQRRGAKDDQYVLVMRESLEGAERVVFDPDVLRRSTGKPHAVNHFAPSRDGRLVALGVSAAGSEEGALRVVEADSGRQIGPEISRVDWGGTQWSPDSSELWFVRRQELKPGMPATEKYQRSTAVRMKPGATEDQVVTAVAHTGPDVSFAPTEFPFLEILSDGRVILGVQDGVSPHFAAWHSTIDRMRAGSPGWKKLFDQSDGITAFVVKGATAYALTFKDAPRLKLLAAPLESFTPASARVVIPPSTRVLVGLAAAQDALYVKLRDGNVNRLLRLSYGAEDRQEEVALPVLGSFEFNGVPAVDIPGVWLDLQGWVRARQIVSVAPSGVVSNTGLQPSGRFDAPQDMVSTEVMVRSHDGTMVPLSIIHKHGVKLDGNNPTLLYGYASYGTTEEPFFSPSRIAWLEAGGVFAVANPRGSGVFGRQWHLDGKEGNKPNTWQDFIACAQYLIDQRWTKPARLAIWGGSAGGILVGRAMTERPDLFAAVVPSVGLLDAVRAELEPNGVPNIPEFGTHKSEAGFRGLLAMSTYHHIRDGVRYPAVLLTHGANDPRVAVWHSTKAAARLQAASSSGKPVLLRLDYDAGHGIGSTKSQAFDERADIFAFLLWQMGVPGYAPRP